MESSSGGTSPFTAPYAIGLEDVVAAQQRLAGHAHVTPVMTCSTLDRMTGYNLHFKCETLQKGGAFKFRGAYNAVSLLSPEEAAKGVVTHSSGNHAAALARAASLRGIPSWIVVPSNTPQCKVDAVKEYGGQLVFCDPTLASRHATCAEVQQRTGATFIPPYDYGPVMAGQGTIALEFLQQVPQLDVLVVPVSGGGMISGIAVAAKGVKPSIRIVAAEPRGTNDVADAAASKQQQRLVTDLPKTATIADGLQAHLGQLTWPVVRDLVDTVVVVSEEDILGAMRLVMERMKLVVEPSGAAGLAAVCTQAFQQYALQLMEQQQEEEQGGQGQGQQAQQSSASNGCDSGSGGGKQLLQVGVVLCGGNLDFGGKGFWRPELWQA